MQSCKFCEIASGQRQAAVVLEDDACLAFLDSRPLFQGHCLLIPKQHHETLDEIPDRLMLPLFSNVRRLACAVQEAMAAEGTFVAINNRVSQSVPHLHVHIVPRRKGDGLRGFFWPRQKYGSEEEMAAVRDAIRVALARLLPGGGDSD